MSKVRKLQYFCQILSLFPLLNTSSTIYTSLISDNNLHKNKICKDIILMDILRKKYRDVNEFLSSKRKNMNLHKAWIRYRFKALNEYYLP